MIDKPIPEFNPDGTPSEATLFIIEEWEGSYRELMTFIASMWDMLRGTVDQNNDKIKLDTGGSEINELLIQSLEGNRTFWEMSYRWSQSYNGGVIYGFSVQ